LVICAVLTTAGTVVVGTGSAYAHALLYRIVEGPAITVQLYFPDNDAPLFEPYQVFAPDSARAHQSGRVNAHGEVTFRPDRPGQWRVQVMTADGHGVDAQISIDAALSTDPASLAAPTPWWQRVVTGLGYLLGIFGLLALWRLHRGTRTPA